MKVIFVDFDGVLNSDAHFAANAERSQRSGDMSMLLDPAKCALLNDCIAATSAKVVISSDWRLRIEFEQIERMLRMRGVLCAEVIGQTPNIVRASEKNTPFALAWIVEQTKAGAQLGDLKNGPWATRGDEIDAWLRTRNDVTAWAILDDNSDGLERFGSAFVHVDATVGLSQDNVDCLIRWLR